MMRLILILLTLATLLGCKAETRYAPERITRAPITCAGGAGGDSGLPNILLVIADDIGAEASSLYPALSGVSGQVPQPALEGLAAQGLVFDAAWATPLCSPTRATIASGMYGHQTGVTHVQESDVLPIDTTTIFDRLADIGYANALIGKYHLGGKYLEDVTHVSDLGVQSFQGVLWNIDDYYDWTDYGLTRPPAQSSVYTTTAFTDYAIDYITTRETECPSDPWFVWLAYYAAHAPLQVPPSTLHSVPGPLVPNTLDTYKAIIQSADTELARVLAHVDLAETTVIYIGDNGTLSTVKDSQPKVRGSKDSVYEGGLRVPLVISGYGVTRTGREPHLVSSVDLHDTIVELAGGTAPSETPGVSLMPLLSAANASSGRTHSFVTYDNNAHTAHRFAIRDTRYKLLKNQLGWQLYDLQANPKESANKYNNANYAAQQASLQAALDVIAADAPAGYFQ